MPCQLWLFFSPYSSGRVMTGEPNMTQERTKERLKYLTETYRLVWVSGLAAISGTLGLFLGTHATPLAALFIGMGIITVVALVVALLYLNRRIQEEIERIDQGKD